MDVVAVIDFETTGLSPAQGDRATEIAAVIVEDGQVVDRYQGLMNAGVRIPSFIESLTGISNSMIRSAPQAAQVMREVAKFVGDIPLVAHNALVRQQVLGCRTCPHQSAPETGVCMFAIVGTTHSSTTAES